MIAYVVTREQFPSGASVVCGAFESAEKAWQFVAKAGLGNNAHVYCCEGEAVLELRDAQR